jgi:hypothetical protein
MTILPRQTEQESFGSDPRLQFIWATQTPQSWMVRAAERAIVRFGRIRRWNLRELRHDRVLGSTGARLPGVQLQPDILVYGRQQGLGHDGFEDLSDLVAHDRD